MTEWCENRLEITGKSVCIDVAQDWISGVNTPHYRHAVQQSIRMFLAGTAGILKPVKTLSYPPYPFLIPKGLGAANAQNNAFEQWLSLLQNDAVIDIEAVRLIERLYQQTGLNGVKWENIPEVSRQIIGPILTRQYADWFGVLTLIDSIGAGACWEKLSVMPERSQPCDMIQIMPTRLASELNGDGNLLKGIESLSSLNARVFDIAWPSGHGLKWERGDIGYIEVLFDSPWTPPCANVIAQVSAVFDCEVKHSYCEPINEIQGFDCYAYGKHVTSGNLLTENVDSINQIEGDLVTNGFPINVSGEPPLVNQASSATA